MKWPVVRLGDVCSVVSGATPKTGNPRYWDGAIPWVTPKDLSELKGKLLHDTPRKLSSDGLASCSATMLPPHSVLLSSRAPIGLLAINTIPVCTNQGFKNLVPKNGEICSHYLYWWLKTNRRKLESMGRGATFKEISKSIVQAVELPLPPLSEQKRIAAILDAADALRAKRRESIAQLDTLLQATFLDMFGDPVTNPMGWPLERVGNVAERVTKGESPKWQGHEYQDDGVLFVTSENVREGWLDISRPKFIPAAFNEKIARSQLRKNDILINLVGASIGRSCLFSGYNKLANVNQAVGVISLHSNVEPIYFAGLLNTPGGKEMLLGNRVEAARANISLTNLREMSIPIPATKVQRQFKEIANGVEKQKLVLNSHCDELRSLFASLQSRAFSDQL